MRYFLKMKDDFTAKIMASSPITSWQLDGETVCVLSNMFIWAVVFLSLKSWFLGETAVEVSINLSVSFNKLPPVITAADN